MTNARTSSGLKVTTSLKAAGVNYQHNRRLAGVKVSSGLKAGGLFKVNHNRRLAGVRS